jgi:hypothetical protein
MSKNRAEKSVDHEEVVMGSKHRTARRRLGVGVLATIGALTLVVASAAPSFANVFTIDHIDKEGNLITMPGDHFNAGYLFKFPTNHPTATVLFTHPTATFPFHCTANEKGPEDGHITLFLAEGPYTVPANDNKQFPAENEKAAAGYQADIILGDLCGEGQPIYFNYSSEFNGTFTSDLESTDTTDKIEIHFHYRDANAKTDNNINCADPAQNPGDGLSDCSASKTGGINVIPDLIPVGTIGLIGLALVVGVGLIVRQRRSRNRATALAGGRA